MARDYREQYKLLNRMARRKSGYRQLWRNWDDYSSKGSHRWMRSDRRNDWESEKRRDHWHSDMDELVKKIEADPYTFLFGKSNEYLQLPRSWSSFCRSFLNPEVSPEHTRNTSPAKEHHERSSAFAASAKTPSEKVENEKNIKMSYATSSHKEHFQFDPISGRMRPTEQPNTQGKQVEKGEDNGKYSPTSLYTGSDGANSYIATPIQDGESQVGKNNVLYMAGPSEPVSVTPEYQTNSTTDTAEQGITQKTNVNEKVKEDDVDLLRASDIRASFFTGPTKQEMAEKKKLAREALERDYASSSDSRTDINNEILRDLKLKKDAGFTTPNKYAIMKDTANYSIRQVLEDARQFVDDIKSLAHDMLKTCERLEAFAFPADTFRVLAYDPASSEIVFAETTSSMHASERIRHPAEVLLHLNNPAKFLPHLVKMKAEGYEVVSGGGDILIFRKTVDELREGMAEIGEVKSDVLPSMNEKEIPCIDATVSDLSRSAPQQRSPNSRIVHRQETVYTGGPPNWSPYPPTSSSTVTDGEAVSTSVGDKRQEQAELSKRSSRIGKGIRRVILSGLATAGTFYAIGVVCEYFITGGQDGLGPEGFTEFEAERRLTFESPLLRTLLNSNLYSLLTGSRTHPVYVLAEIGTGLARYFFLKLRQKSMIYTNHVMKDGIGDTNGERNGGNCIEDSVRDELY
ncbi:hypothetical protein UA08_02748 [Talaromyces atroroseus]|uniref:Uncharacterized protein n=1 Tax=Talaromyces atroroseus TaxID=1441469 RepID=A0A225B5C1_TALAT|nr:hypothetical protein UA08_02748 [Talaromyces atroroseus]OKL62065.1 hypothetical protein UA08_02748 [Talaromyces atroroseus]